MADPQPYIERMTIQNVACIKHATFELTRLHAFIGPNDSGKSTLLRTISTVAQAGRPTQLPAEQLSALGAVEFSVGGVRFTDASRLSAPLGGGAQTLRLDGDALRKPSTLIPESSPIGLASYRGDGLVAVCDAISNRDFRAWLDIGERFVALFPTAARLELSNVTSTTKALAVLLRDGTRINANQMSEGMLYWLAFATLMHARRPGVYLVEEPENGLHPARIREVVQMLREVSKTAQVVMATHSPLVINELQPDEVSIVTRTTETGTKVTPMKDTPNFEKRNSVYSLGELWLSYADGELEAELVPRGEAST